MSRMQLTAWLASRSPIERSKRIAHYSLECRSATNSSQRHFILRDPERLPAAVADVARITHLDPRSVAGGIAIAKAAQLLATVDLVDEVSFCRAIADAIRPYSAIPANLTTGVLEADRTKALAGSYYEVVSLRVAQQESYDLGTVTTGS
jgi:ADP-ribosylglycohydrolase